MRTVWNQSLRTHYLWTDRPGTGSPCQQQWLCPLMVVIYRRRNLGENWLSIKRPSGFIVRRITFHTCPVFFAFHAILPRLIGMISAVIALSAIGMIRIRVRVKICLEKKCIYFQNKCLLYAHGICYAESNARYATDAKLHECERLLESVGS